MKDELINCLTNVQVDFEIWEPKLPKDYKEIIQMSKCPEDYSTIKKEDLYNIFSEGILLQEGKVVISLLYYISVMLFCAWCVLCIFYFLR